MAKRRQPRRSGDKTGESWVAGGFSCSSNELCAVELSKVSNAIFDLTASNGGLLVAESVIDMRIFSGATG